MPISSLPSPYGIGTFGKAAYDFADFLHAAGQGYWQLLPLGPTSYGDSPYQSFSTFAGNPYFIDLDLLIKDKLLTRKEVTSCAWGSEPRYVDYGKIYESRFALLDALLSPVISVIKTTPVASFVILVLIWLRRDYVPVLISALMVFPVVWSNVSAGIKSTERSFLELARVYDFSFIKTVRSIYFPSVLPYFRSACSSALGFGWKAGIAAEVLTVPGVSIGRMIYESKLYLQTTDLFAWTLCVILLSFLLEKLVLRLISGGGKNA